MESLERMKVTLKQIRNSNLDKKNGPNSFLVKYLRPLGDPITYLLLRLKIKPTTVTYANFILVFVVFFVLAFLDSASRVFAIFLLIVWQLLDIVDGNMARALNSCSKYGGFVDHICGLFLLAFFQLSIGVGLYFYPEGSLNLLIDSVDVEIQNIQVIILIASALSSIAAIHIRLLHANVQDTFGGKAFHEYEYDFDESVKISFFTRGVRIIRNFEYLGGFQILIMLLAAIFNLLEIGVIFYFFLNMALLLGYTANLLYSFRNEH